MKRLLLVIAIIAGFPILSCSALSTGETEQSTAPAETGEVAAPLGINEHLGATIPLDLSFRAEDGSTVVLRDLFTKPTILSLVYYECPGICTPTLTAIAKVLRELKLEPGQDYNVVTVSFDETELPPLAARKQASYIKSIGKPFPTASWRFLTGDADAIKTLTDAIGFAFKRDGEDFIHPASLIVLSAEGKISRYLYGVGYLPFDVQMALVEASEGRVGPTINRLLRFCFAYDPKGQTYALEVTKIAGGVVTLVGAGFLMYLIFSAKRKPPHV